MAIEYKKPTTYIADSGTAFSNPAQAYDGSPGDETTCADQYNAADGIARWHIWVSKVETYTATQLHVKWKTSGGFDNDAFAIEYTKNGGGTWLELVPMGVHNETTIQDSNIALDANQDLTQVEVRVNFDRVGGGDKDYLYIYDIWTEGEYTAGGVSVPVNQIVSKIVMFAVTVLTGATVLVGQLTANVTPYSPTVKTGAKVETNLLITKVVPYPVTVEVAGGVSVDVNLITTNVTPYSPTIKTGATFEANLLTSKVVPYEVTVETVSGVTIPVSQLITKVVPYEVTINTIGPTILKRPIRGIIKDISTKGGKVIGK